MAVLARRWMQRSSLACLLVSAGIPAWPAQSNRPSLAAALPDAPQPQVSAPELQGSAPQSSSAPQAKSATHPNLAPAGPCELRNAAATLAATAAVRAEEVSEAYTAALAAPPRIVGVTLCVPHVPIINWYARFLNGPQVKALTPLQKAHLAGRNLIDPFNLLTIAGGSAFTVATNSHSPEGPGFHGWANDMGVSFTQDMVGEFFGTFLIPSITHQDPHYHRMPNASIKRRAVHCIAQIAWTEGDNGKGMPNYADLVGFAADESINNLYVPGQKTNLRASTARYGLDLSTAPIDNFITEFLPDLASHIHVRIVLVQQIINQAARTDTAAGP